MSDNWEVSPRGTKELLAKHKKELADAFRAGWVARDSLAPISGTIRFDEHGGGEWFEIYLEQKDEKE